MSKFSIGESSWLLGLAMSLALVPSAFAAQSADSTPQAATASFKAHVLSRAELDTLLKEPKKILVIDVRRPDEISSIGGLPVYLSVQADELESELSWIPKDRTIVTLSNHGLRAGKAADLLASHGFKVAGAADAEAYEREGGTLTKIAPQPVPAAKPAVTQGSH
jgi:rhodanese-related sulfurtransferase